MKGGFYGLKRRQISLFLLALACTTLVIWACNKTSFLSTIIPSQSGLFQLSPESHNTSVVDKETEIGLLKSPYDASYKNGELFESEKKTSQLKDKKPFDAPDAINPAISPSIEEKGSLHKDNAGSINIFKDRENMNSTSAGNKACNYAIGKWVFDDNHPLYSGSGCKQWLSGMWACHLNQRTDFAYEKLKWQPKNCQMEEFTAPKFLERMRHKTLAFIGDSLGRQQFQSMMCMASAGQEMPDVVNVGWEYGLVKARGAKRPDGWAYRFPTTNTTILYYWSASLCDLEPLDPTNPQTEYAMHLDRPPSFLSRYIERFHVVVLNTGHHWNRGKLTANRWIMHIGGSPSFVNKIDDMDGAKNFTIYSIVNWVNTQLPKYPGMKAFYRSISPRHFLNGDWNTGGTCDNITPLSNGKEVFKEVSDDPFPAGAVKGKNVKFLDVTAISKLRDEGHVSRYSIRPTPGMQDCLHWCLPGVPDTWNEILFAQI
ncbi:protein trichome birefringence-like 14 [Impatiens glandulifera]|uniref:protein trichome birefringence-like 14 n=1 Tax=Impatiens glandulifera TaxID=253017 RepID=UPI001FB0DCB8|nr:protein trichome birefringence-like 14 [Impatiens glandulifera]